MSSIIFFLNYLIAWGGKTKRNYKHKFNFYFTQTYNVFDRRKVRDSRNTWWTPIYNSMKNKTVIQLKFKIVLAITTWNSIESHRWNDNSSFSKVRDNSVTVLRFLLTSRDQRQALIKRLLAKSVSKNLELNGQNKITTRTCK